MDKENTNNTEENINKYRWYHRIKVADGLSTNPVPEDDQQPSWDFILDCIKNIDFKDKRVLDIGCRDGLFSFEAEKRGAKEIVAIDNDISRGAVDFLIPFFNSKVKMSELNLYELTPEKYGFFDIILFFGVLYHLRYPFWGLKKITDCLSDKGILVVESGMLNKKILENDEFLYCPTEKSPYEPSSCTFFNEKGLITTLCSLNCELLDHKSKPMANNAIKWEKLSLKKIFRYFARKLEKIYLYLGKNPLGFYTKITHSDVNRQLFIFRKNVNLITPKIEAINQYWNSTHVQHSYKKWAKK
jgi:SAM-dependent methyltransferase